MPSQPCSWFHLFRYKISNWGAISAALGGGVIPLYESQDTQCYNYTLPQSFASLPDIAVATQNFDMDPSNSIFFYVKPLQANSISSVSFVVRTQWTYTKWTKLTFSFIAEDHNDLETGYLQIDSGRLASCHNGARISLTLPFKQQFSDSGHINHNLFLHGFEITTIPISG